MIATITTGKEEVEGASAKVHAFVHLPRVGEEHVAKCTQPARCRKLGNVAWQDAVNDGNADARITGAWGTSNYEIAEGTLIKVFANVKARWNGLPIQHSLWLLAGESFDLVRLHIRLTQSARCALQEVHMTGKFRVLTLAEAVRAHGVPRPNADWAAQFMALDNRNSLMTLEVLERGHRQRTPAPVATPQPEPASRRGRNRTAALVPAPASQALTAEQMNRLHRLFGHNVGQAAQVAGISVTELAQATEGLNAEQQRMLEETARTFNASLPGVAVSIEGQPLIPPAAPTPAAAGGLKRRRRLFSR